MTMPGDAALQCLQTFVIVPCIVLAVGFWFGFFAQLAPQVMWLRSHVTRYGGAMASIALMFILNRLLALLF